MEFVFQFKVCILIASLAPDGPTVLCSGLLNRFTYNLNGKTYTKRNKEQISNLIENEDWDEIERSCTNDITDMEEMFISIKTFEANLSSWNTDQVTTMQKEFYNTPVPEPGITSWDTSQVTGQPIIWPACFEVPICSIKILENGRPVKLLI
eukprot:gb/GECH01013017.1/.p1 GENE.gb/GECH01013017.1/~~gb/GECH01013017.1/.p1  ORF type:complete len:151 (+),score=7.17 gb/GECH01013017.1/:1-453(+)